MSETYMSRIADQQLAERLSYMGAVLIRGAKWCGKTSTAARQAKSVLYMQDPDTTKQNMSMAEIKPSYLLEGEKPRLLDEWQMAPVLWDAVRFAVDQQQLNGLFILTGSATPNDDAVMHSGTGRIARLTMRSMSLFESQESTGEVSLSELFDVPDTLAGFAKQTVDDYAYLIARGGWPKAVTDSRNNKDHGLRTAFEYIDSIVESDISKVDDVKRNPQHARSLLRAFARNTAQQASLTTIRSDIEADGFKISEGTLSSYINALRRMFVLDELSAFSPRMRSKTALRTAPTWHLIDPSLSVAALNADPDRLLADLETMGFMFESMCVRDLRVYASSMNGDVMHFRDRTGLEVDAIVSLHDGRWGAVEIKLGGQSRIDEASAHLHQVEQRIDTSRTKAPVFKLVLTGGQYAYRRDDGVYVVPIACLRP